jgi:anti-anti-sigma regulatory factor
LEIRVRRQEDCHVVELNGVGDAALLGMLLATVSRLALEDGPVVVDLSDVTLVAPDALRATLEALSDVGGLRVVSTRDTARVILRRCGLAGDSLFPSVEAALEGMPRPVQEAVRDRAEMRLPPVTK